jgi:tetratricopeptide (TPR) repeat protein
VLTLTELVEEFRAETSLDAFDTTGDTRTDVRSVFSWSLRRLEAPVARVFRLLGLIPGGDIDAYALAALAGTDPADAEAIAFILSGAHLVEVSADGRFSMHDLLRAYAAESCAQQVSADERHDALTRLLDFYLATATRAVDTKFVFNTPLVGEAAPASLFCGTVPDIDDIPAAAAWLAAERPNMVRACVHAARHGWPRHAVALALTLRSFLDDGHDQDGLTVHSESLAAAEIIGDPVSAARLRTSLAIAHSRVGHMDVAGEHAERAYDEQQRHGDLVGAVVSLAVLCSIRMSQGRYREGVDYEEQALQLARRLGNRTMEANQLYNLANDYMLLEDFEAAAEHYRLAATAYGDAAADDGQPAHDSARGGLATALAGLGRLDEAMVLAEEATAIEFANGSTLDGVSAMTTLGSVYRRLRRLDDALEVLDFALDVCATLDNPTITALVLNAQGDTHRDLGNQARATACYRQAHELADRVGDPFETARSLMGLGDAHAANGEREQARACWQSALDTYTRLGMPSAARARERLSTLD